MVAKVKKEKPTKEELKAVKEMFKINPELKKCFNTRLTKVERKRAEDIIKRLKAKEGLSV